MPTNIDETDAAPISDPGLSASLTGLSGLVAGSSTLQQLLTEVANFAVRAVRGADGAGVTTLEAGHPDTIVASAQFVRDVDSIQYRLGEGPCISAASQRMTTSSGSLGNDESWPTFGPQAAFLGINSAISLPLLLNANAEVVGAINVYAHAHNAFDTSSLRLGELFASPAAVAVHNARLLEHAQRERARLESALTSRSAIDRAVGIVMSHSGISAGEAFKRLRIKSQHEHVKMTAVATRIIDEAVRRAQARIPDSHQQRRATIALQAATR